MTIATVNGVKNAYGPRSRYEGVAGSMGCHSEVRSMVIWFDGANYTNVTATLPAGATLMENALVEVAEAFVLGGTTPVINIGKSGNEGTDRLAQVSQAQAQAVGWYSIATAGILAKDTPVSTAVTIKVALGGTSPTITNAGKMKVTIPYRVA